MKVFSGGIRNGRIGAVAGSRYHHTSLDCADKSHGHNRNDVIKGRTPCEVVCGDAGTKNRANSGKFLARNAERHGSAHNLSLRKSPAAQARAVQETGTILLQKEW